MRQWRAGVGEGCELLYVTLLRQRIVEQTSFAAVVCDPGKYLSLKEQDCLACAAGTFSLGGGVRYEDFSKDDLPSVFTIKNQHALGGDADCPKKCVNARQQRV